jgi:branched-chain amino acid transport system substrate-binding protein
MTIRTTTRRAVMAGAATLEAFGARAARAQQAGPTGEVKVGLLVPLSGPWARFGEIMRKGAELAVRHVNDRGGIAPLGGARMRLVVFDAGDSTEKAKNAAQRMVAQETDMVAATGAYLSSFTLAATEVTERAELPVLTLSYSDLITGRGFRYVFQTSSRAGDQARDSIPTLMRLAESASGRKPETVGIITDNTAASVSFVEPIRAEAQSRFGLRITVDETFTPPMADATPLVQRLRSRRPDMLIFPVTVISDAKLVLEKMNELGLGRGRLPTIANGIAVAQTDMLQAMRAEDLEGLMTVVANWDAKGQEAIIEDWRRETGEPWMTQNAISTYGDIWIVKHALETAPRADRHAVAQAIRAMDVTDGPAEYFPGRRIKFDEKGLRVNAGLIVVQWQRGRPVTVFPPESAVAEAFWPRRT